VNPRGNWSADFSLQSQVKTCVLFRIITEGNEGNEERANSSLPLLTCVNTDPAKGIAAYWI
jgi:hypothetical protein